MTTGTLRDQAPALAKARALIALARYRSCRHFAEFLGDTAGLPDVPTHQEISADVAELLRHWRDEPLASARAEYQALSLIEEILIEQISPAEGAQAAEPAIMTALVLVQQVRCETNDRINTELVAEERRGAK